MKSIILGLIILPTVSLGQVLPTGCLFPDEIDTLTAYGPNDRVLPSLNKALCIINALQQEVLRKGSAVSSCVSEVLIEAGARNCIRFSFDSLISLDSPVTLSVVSDDLTVSVIPDGTSSISQTGVDGCFFNTNPDRDNIITACASGVPE